MPMAPPAAAPREFPALMLTAPLCPLVADVPAFSVSDPAAAAVVPPAAMVRFCPGEPDPEAMT